MLETAMLKVCSTDAPLDDRQRRLPDPRRAGLFHRPPDGAHAPRRPDQPDRRRGERGPHLVHRDGRHARSGEEFRAVRDALSCPWKSRPAGPLHLRLPAAAAPLSQRADPLAGAFAARGACRPDPPIQPSGRGALFRNREAIIDRQLVQEPIAEAAMELYASACVLSRRDAELTAPSPAEGAAAWEPAAADLFLRVGRPLLRGLASREQSRQLGDLRSGAACPGSQLMCPPLARRFAVTWIVYLRR